MKKVLLLFLFMTLPVIAAHKHLEKDYQKVWCDRCGGVMEYKLDDKARVDCLTQNYAVEFDFASKWAESIGQALYYGIKTNKQPAIVLIMENKKDDVYLKRLNVVCTPLNIKVFTMDSKELEK